MVAERLRKSLDSQGTLAVLRQGFEMVGVPGLRSAVAMCQFKPALAMNADLQARYAANRLRVVRQVHYAVHHQNSIDLVLFVNGIAAATAELKSHYTQRVQDAVYQGKTDRTPFFKPRNVAEPLLAFPGGALVHFAVSNAAAEMTTRLAGLDTSFLPFNRGNAGGAGNPPNLSGQAGIATDQERGLVMTSSHKEAVRWQKATRKDIADHGYKIETLVAFWGEVIDLDSGPDPFTERSLALNPKLGGRDIRSALKGGDYQLLLVANKFQTGFDEPLLCAMDVDKRLGGIQAVQTLSRLNRCYPAKDQTYVVDFVNGLQARTSEMDAAILPVASRLLTAIAQARQAWQTWEGASNDAKRPRQRRTRWTR